MHLFFCCVSLLKCRQGKLSVVWRELKGCTLLDRPIRLTSRLLPHWATYSLGTSCRQRLETGALSWLLKGAIGRRSKRIKWNSKQNSIICRWVSSPKDQRFLVNYFYSPAYVVYLPLQSTNNFFVRKILERKKDVLWHCILFLFLGMSWQVEWNGGSDTMVEILARIQQREDAAVKRERAMAYAFSHQVHTNY